MTLKVVAITPRKALFEADRLNVAIDTYLHAFTQEFVKEMSTYPPFQPWRSPPPRTGPRAGGRRTGEYGRGWSRNIHYTKSSVTILNEARDIARSNRPMYAVVVGGSRRQDPGQARVLARRGWKSVQDVGPEVNLRVLPRFSRVIATGHV